MCKRVSLPNKVFFITTLFTIVYNEHLNYIVNSWTWARLKCKNETNCVKMLLVADPQLIGERNEIFHFITPISIWDSDRFLEKTYSLVVNHVKPDVVIFLGDLLDEGSIANTEQYNRYLQRLFTIFATSFPIKHIWLPGDNDIGGETDRVTYSKIKRFDAAFAQAAVINIKHVKFSKINRMLIDSPKSFDYIDNKNENKISIILSHMPLISVPALYVDKALDVLKPNLIFAAHEHKSRVIITNIYQQYRKIIDLSAHDNKINEYKFDAETIYEILVPTSSYRMGTVHVGYGGAIIENDGSMEYTVFWSPYRFIYLYIYLFLIVSILTYNLIQPILKLATKSRIIPIYKPNYSYKIVKNGF